MYTDPASLVTTAMAQRRGAYSMPGTPGNFPTNVRPYSGTPGHYMYNPVPTFQASGYQKGQPVDGMWRMGPQVAMPADFRPPPMAKPQNFGFMGMKNGQPVEYDSNAHMRVPNPGGFQKGQPVNGWKTPQQMWPTPPRQVFAPAPQLPLPAAPQAQIAPGTPGGPVIPPLQLHPPGAVSSGGHPLMVNSPQAIANNPAGVAAGMAALRTPAPQQTTYRAASPGFSPGDNRLGH
jgi:hypothetical protein